VVFGEQLRCGTMLAIQLIVGSFLFPLSTLWSYSDSTCDTVPLGRLSESHSLHMVSLIKHIIEPGDIAITNDRTLVMGKGFQERSWVNSLYYTQRKDYRLVGPVVQEKNYLS